MRGHSSILVVIALCERGLFKYRVACSTEIWINYCNLKINNNNNNNNNINVCRRTTVDHESNRDYFFNNNNNNNVCRGVKVVHEALEHLSQNIL